MDDLHSKSVAVVIVACFASNASCNPLVLVIVKLPSVMVACFVPISVITFVEPTINFSAVKSPSTTTSPVILKVDISGNVPFAVSSKVSLAISVILAT
jgi:hypothetical protein